MTKIERVEAEILDAICPDKKAYGTACRPCAKSAKLAALAALAALPPSDNGLVEVPRDKFELVLGLAEMTSDDVHGKLADLIPDHAKTEVYAAIAECKVALSTHGKQWSDSAPTEKGYYWMKTQNQSQWRYTHILRGFTITTI